MEKPGVDGILGEIDCVQVSVHFSHPITPSRAHLIGLAQQDVFIRIGRNHSAISRIQGIIPRPQLPSARALHSQTKIRPSRRLRALAVARRQPRFPSHRPESFLGRLQTSEVSRGVCSCSSSESELSVHPPPEVHEDHSGMVGQISTGCRPPQPACVRPGSSARCTANVVSALYRSVRHSAQFSIFSPLIRLNAWSLVTSTAPNAKA